MSTAHSAFIARSAFNDLDHSPNCTSIVDATNGVFVGLLKLNYIKETHLYSYFILFLLCGKHALWSMPIITRMLCWRTSTNAIQMLIA